MGIASSRTTDTGVFIRPTAETGWKEISLLQKRKKRSSPLVELDVFLDLFELVFGLVHFLLLFCFSKIPASAAATKRSAHPYHNHYYYQPIVSSSNATHAYSRPFFVPLITHRPFARFFRVSFQRKEEAWPFSLCC
jgi:hypothetical protein